MTQFKSIIDFLYLWWGSWYFLHSCFFVSICVSPSLMTAAATQVKSVYCLKTQLCVFKLNFAKYCFTPTVKSMLCEKSKTEILTMAVVKIPFEHACLWYGSSKWSFLMDRWAKEAQGCWDSNWKQGSWFKEPRCHANTSLPTRSRSSRWSSSEPGSPSASNSVPTGWSSVSVLPPTKFSHPTFAWNWLSSLCTSRG